MSTLSHPGGQPSAVATSGAGSLYMTTAAPTPTSGSETESGSARVGTYYVDGYCPPQHSLAMATGVGVAAGVFVAAIIILAFAFFRRRQTRRRKSSQTISPDVLVTGPMVDNTERWEEYHEEPQTIVQGRGSLKNKEPPAYAKVSLH